MPSPPVVGAVLAGGLSSRLGHDKALIRLKNNESVDLLGNTAAMLHAVTGSVFIVGRESRSDFPSVKDRTPGLGPVGGIATALHHAGGAACFVLSCDLPFMNAELLQRLLLKRNERPAPTLMTAYQQEDTGHIESLVSIFEPGALPFFEQCLEQNRLKVTKTVPPEAQFLIPYSLEESLPFFNINYPADLELARRLLTQGAV